MRQCYFGALLLSLILFPLVPAPAQAPDAKPDLGANAAMKYWQAFALMPTPDKDQEKLLWDGYKAPVDAAAAKLIDESLDALLKDEGRRTADLGGKLGTRAFTKALSDEIARRAR